MTQCDLLLIELHRHLEGSIRPQTIVELGEKHGRPLASDLEGLRSLNPTASGVTLPHEFLIAAPAAGLNRELIHQAKRKFFEPPFLRG